MKKLLALTLAALMVFGMVACASNTDSTPLTPPRLLIPRPRNRPTPPPKPTLPPSPLSRPTRPPRR